MIRVSGWKLRRAPSTVNRLAALPAISTNHFSTQFLKTIGKSVFSLLHFLARKLQCCGTSRQAGPNHCQTHRDRSSLARPATQQSAPKSAFCPLRLRNIYRGIANWQTLQLLLGAKIFPTFPTGFPQVFHKPKKVFHRGKRRNRTFQKGQVFRPISPLPSQLVKECNGDHGQVPIRS